MEIHVPLHPAVPEEPPDLRLDLLREVELGAHLVEDAVPAEPHDLREHLLLLLQAHLGVPPDGLLHLGVESDEAVVAGQRSFVRLDLVQCTLLCLCGGPAEVVFMCVGRRFMIMLFLCMLRG